MSRECNERMWNLAYRLAHCGEHRNYQAIEWELQAYGYPQATREPAQGWTPYAPRHRRPGFHKIAGQFGVATGTVQRIAHG